MIRCGVAAMLLVVLASYPAVAAEQNAANIIKESGVAGGLVVHLGCGDGKLTATLRGSGRYLVHGLDRDPRNIELARQNIRDCPT